MSYSIVVFYQITNPAKAVYKIQSLKKGIKYLAITTLRDIIGKMNLNETFDSKDGIHSQLRVIIDEATGTLSSLGIAKEMFTDKKIKCSKRVS